MKRKAARSFLAFFLVLSVLAPCGGAMAAGTGTQVSEAARPLRQAAQKTTAAKVKKPSASIKGGTYAKQKSVKLTTKTKGAKIYYTTNGKKPTKNSKRYANAIKIKKTTTLRAVAIKKGKKSALLKVKYTIRASAPASPPGPPPAYTARRGYLACSKKEKTVYNALYEGIAKFKSTIKVPGSITESTLSRVICRIDLDNPELLQLPHQWQYAYDTRTGIVETVSFPYRCGKNTYNARMAAMDRRVDEIIAGALQGESVAEQLEIVHDEILQNARYDLWAPNAYDAYGVLVDGRGVCESYSRAFQYICQKMDIPVLLANGDGLVAVFGYWGFQSWSWEPHMWNMVQVDGAWLHVDLTWDEPDFPGGEPLRDFFLVYDSEIYQRHRLDPIAGPYDGAGHFNYYAIPRTAASAAAA